MHELLSIQSFASLVGLVVSIGGTIYAWISARSKAAAAEIERLELAVAAQEKRVTALEQAMQHLPDKDSMHRLEMTVEGVKGQLSVVAKSLEGVDRIAQRIDTYLLERGSP